MSDGMQPFRIEIPQADVDYLHDRLANARWPGELPGVEWARGVPLGYLKELSGYWRTHYDWRAAEARLNHYPQFTTEIDGQRIHFLHVQSGQPGAKPLLITHGFPSSVAEFLHLIEPLVNPATGQAFHVAAPSLPGYAFSTPLGATGWAMGRTARAWAELMRRLGYHRYGVHGGDVGAACRHGRWPGRHHVLGVHVVTDPLTAANVATFLPGMADRLDENDPVDKLILGRMEAFTKEGSGTWRSRTAGRRPSATAWPTPRCCSSPGSPRKSTSGPTCRSTATSCSPRSACTGSPAPAPPPPTPSTSRHTPPTGAPAPGPAGLRGLRRRRDRAQLVPAPASAHWTEFPRGKHFPAMKNPADLAADLQAFFGLLPVTEVLSQRGLNRATLGPASTCSNAPQHGRSTRSSTWAGCRPRRRSPRTWDCGPASRTSRRTNCRR